MNIITIKCNVALATFLALYLLQISSCWVASNRSKSSYPYNLDGEGVDLLSQWRIWMIFNPFGDRIRIVTSSQQIADVLKPSVVKISFGDTNNNQCDNINFYKILLVDTFATKETESLGEINSIKISGIALSEWKPQIISLTHGTPKKTYYFPIDRRLNKATEYNFGIYDAFLPQNDPFPKQRSREIKANRDLYEYAVTFSEGKTRVLQVKSVPTDEGFTGEFFARVGSKSVVQIALNALKKLKGNEPWSSYDSMKQLSKTFLSTYPVYATNQFKSEEYFGSQRLQGGNPGLVKLISEIPANFPVTERMVRSRLENYSLKEALDANKIFLVDFWIMKDIYQDIKVAEIPAPLGLFFLNADDNLIPLAIQLQQDPSPDNPIFTPDHNNQTWLLAKLFFNLADSTYQGGITHLGNIHFMLERVIIATYRCLSPSHPVFRLMKPHFLFTMATNSLALKGFLDPNSIFSTPVSVTGKGILYLTTLGLQEYNMSVDGNMHEKFKIQGTTKKTIPKYPYRDDVTKCYDVIKKYVTEVIKIYYKERRSDLQNDFEIQEWRKELGRSSQKFEGAEIKGVPGSDTDGFRSLNELIETVTAIIHTASCKHSSINYMQYDYFGFPPNSPFSLKGPIPTTTEPVTERYILDQFGTRNQLIDLLIFGKLLITKGSNLLGDFETPSLYHPDAVLAVKKFLKDIDKLSNDLTEINQKRPITYPYGNPAGATNSVSA